MSELKQVTGFEAGLSGDDQIRIALQRMIERGGEAQMPDIYEAVEARLRPIGLALSTQGRDWGCTLRDEHSPDFIPRGVLLDLKEQSSGRHRRCPGRHGNRHEAQRRDFLTP